MGYIILSSVKLTSMKQLDLCDKNSKYKLAFAHYKLFMTDTVDGYDHIDKIT